MILVDASVWIDWLRQGSQPASLVFDRLVDEDDIRHWPTRQACAIGAPYARCR